MVIRVLTVPKVLRVLVLKVLKALMVLMVLCPAVGSAQTRDAATRGGGTAVITGIVVSDDAEARPVRKARVTCGGAGPQGQTTITDDKGRFSFSGLVAGRYTVTAAKEAWITASYGAKRPLRPGSAIPVAAGETADIVLRLPRGGVIAGTVLDHNAQPASGTTVRTFRYVTANGERRLAQAGNAATSDDRGAYRIYGLPPGDYVVGALGRMPGPAMPAGDLRLTTDLDVRHATSGNAQAPPPPERGVAFATTYYPGSTVGSQAGVISIGKGEERDGVDFNLQIVPTARVEGIVTLPEGGFPSGAEINLVAASQTLSTVSLDALRTGVVAPDGTFSFAGVSPGQYSLLVRVSRVAANPDGTSGPPQLVWASTDLSVDGEHISGLNLRLAPGMTIAGRVRFEGALAPLGNLSTVRVTLQPAQREPTVSFTPPAAAVSPDGRFTIAGVTPGRYRLTASFPGSGRPGHWTLRSSVVNGQDSLDIPFVVAPGQHVGDASITFADRLAQLSGAVQSAGGAAVNTFTVILFPTDQALWLPQSRRIQGMRPSADGAFTFRNLPAGEYLLAAIDDVEPGEWFDPSFLQRLLPTAMTIAIAEGEQKVQDIRLSNRQPHLLARVSRPDWHDCGRQRPPLAAAEQFEVPRATLRQDDLKETRPDPGGRNDLQPAVPEGTGCAHAARGVLVQDDRQRDRRTKIDVAEIEERERDARQRHTSDRNSAAADAQLPSSARRRHDGKPPVRPAPRVPSFDVEWIVCRPERVRIGRANDLDVRCRLAADQHAATNQSRRLQPDPQITARVAHHQCSPAKLWMKGDGFVLGIAESFDLKGAVGAGDRFRCEDTARLTALISGDRHLRVNEAKHRQQGGACRLVARADNHAGENAAVG